MALYIESLQATVLYANAEWLWLVCPLLLYWYGRLALLVHRGKASDDPVNFALKDRVSWIVAACLAVILVISI